MKHFIIALLVAIGAYLLFLFPFQLLQNPAMQSVIRVLALCIIASSLGFIWISRVSNVYIKSLEHDCDHMKLMRKNDLVKVAVFNEIGEILEFFSETRDAELVIKKTVDVLTNLLRVEYVVIRIMSDKESTMMMRAESGDTDIDLGEELIAETVWRGRSKLINNLAHDDRYNTMFKKGYRSLVACPMFTLDSNKQKRGMGLICALSKLDHNFSAHDLDMLNLFSSEACLIIENANLYNKTSELAIRDGLTSLFNHSHFKETLELEITKAKKAGEAVSLIIGDIDNFKVYNDNNGHPQGDALLRQLSQILIDGTRRADTVARYGGEEFVIILPKTDINGAMAVGEAIRRKIESFPFPNQEKQPSGNLTITFGVACYPADAQEPGLLIEKADKALYHGKHSTKNVVISYDKFASDTAS